MNSKNILRKIEKAKKLLQEINYEIKLEIEYSPDFTVVDAIAALDELETELKTTLGE
jgi:hypothetical protein